MTRKQHATMADVARHARVGVTTVSYVLRNISSGWSISDQTRKRVQEAARKINYQPNAAARALATRKTGYIGFLLSDEIGGGWTNHYFAGQLAGVEDAARDRGYGLSINRYNFTHIDKVVLPDQVGRRSVDGLILAGAVCRAAVMRLTEFELPCFSIGDTFEYKDLVPSVTHAFAQGLHHAVKHLAQLGHRRIIWCRQKESTGSARNWAQLQQYIAADETLKHCHVIDYQLSGLDEQHGGAFFEHWYVQDVEQRATGIIIGRSMMMPFMQQLQIMGLQCPLDVSLISATDHPMFAYHFPPITAIEHHCYKLGEIAANKLIDHLEGGSQLEPTISPVPTTLVVRGSCASISD